MGDRLSFCQQAVAQLASSDLTITKISSLYETEPVDYLHQEMFYNAVIAIKTTLSPIALLQRCQAIEQQFGKKISIPKGPRTLDLDILFYGDQIIHQEDLVIPHPAALQRRFVLMPLAEIAPDFCPPTVFQTIENLLKNIPNNPQVKKVCGPEWAHITGDRGSS